MHAAAFNKGVMNLATGLLQAADAAGYTQPPDASNRWRPTGRLCLSSLTSAAVTDINL